MFSSTYCPGVQRSKAPSPAKANSDTTPPSSSHLLQALILT